MKELVSIIVPIYNVEEYLAKCVDSILAQTYKNIEIILVNDGSPDNCLNICLAYAKNDSRVTVINKKNGGLSDARNAGIAKATGKYLVFIDSDDYIENNMIEELYNNITKNQADISICNFYITIDNIDTKNKCILNKVINSDGRNVYEMIYSKYAIQTIVSWNKMYKKELFDKCKYPVGLIHEDQYIICDILNQCKRVSYITDKFLYHYVQRKNSIMKTFNMKRFDIVKGLNERILFFEKINEGKLVARTKLEKVQSLHYILSEYEKTKNDSDNDRVVENYRKEYLKTLEEIKINDLNILSKLKYILIKKNPKLYDYLKR